MQLKGWLQRVITNQSLRLSLLFRTLMEYRDLFTSICRRACKIGKPWVAFILIQISKLSYFEYLIEWKWSIIIYTQDWEQVRTITGLHRFVLYRNSLGRTLLNTPFASDRNIDVLTNHKVLLGIAIAATLAIFIQSQAMTVNWMHHNREYFSVKCSCWHLSW